MNHHRRRGGAAPWILWTVAGLLVAAMVLLAVMGIPKKPTVTPEEKAVPVRTLAVEAREMADMIILPGQVHAISETVLATEKGGRVVEIFVDRGDAVEKNQVLLRLDDRLWKSHVRQAEVECADAEKDFARWTKMKEEGAVSDSDFEKIKQRRDMAEIRLDQATINVSQCEVRSPVAGVVDERYMELGQYAQEGHRAFRLVVYDRVKVVFDVPEQDVLSIHPGLSMVFHVTAYPDRVHTGKLSYVAVSGSPESNSYRAEILVKNTERDLKPGMLAGVSLARKRASAAIVLPLAAVIPQKGEHVVFVVENRRAVRRVVRMDTIIGRDVLLASGVKPGDRVVVEGHRTLQDGIRVDVRDGS